MVHFFTGNTDLRYMGSSWLLVPDFAIFFLSLCFNLAGLPYSAGFIGKEFLLFQFFKNDWGICFIRIAWLGAFVMTPLYMFLLVYGVLFGSRKALQPHFTILTPSSTFLSNLQNNFSISWVAVTSVPSVWVLITFWIFFITFGETLYLYLYEFSATYWLNSSNLLFHVSTNNFFSLTSLSPSLVTNLNLNIYLSLWLVTWLLALSRFFEHDNFFAYKNVFWWGLFLVIFKSFFLL
jgi:formate hydrogenlyase subunit 3/multisubunit Na+/H+ antiporter MnhD subunit